MAAQSTDTTGSKPRLVVLLVVDQMRADYLTRWSSLYKDGLHRLLTHGAVFTNTSLGYTSSETAPGQATIATGTFPSKHGITGDRFFDRTLGRQIGAETDSTVKMTGGYSGPSASPKNLRRTTLSDWLRKASPLSKIYAVSLKDEGTVFMGGDRPDGAYWYDGRSGDFVTSAFYRKTLPPWVDQFDESRLKNSWRDSLWTKCAPESSYVGSDTVQAEAGGIEQSAFPHYIVAMNDFRPAAYFRSLIATPFADQYELRFCEKLIPKEHLGLDKRPDLLAISLSASDFIGNAYGPDSHEVEDYFLRLDKELGIFLDSLDSYVRDSNYVLVLTANHGVCPLPELSTSAGGMNSRRVSVEKFESDMARQLSITFPNCPHPESLLVRVAGGFVVDSAKATKCSLPLAFVMKRAAGAIESLDYVAEVFRVDQLPSDSADHRRLLQSFRNSYYPSRCPDLFVNFKKGILLDALDTGTHSGSPYSYDTDVPLIFYGHGIGGKTVDEPAQSVDIAPTLAFLLGIAPDSGTDGHVLSIH